VDFPSSCCDGNRPKVSSTDVVVRDHDFAMNKTCNHVDMVPAARLTGANESFIDGVVTWEVSALGHGTKWTPTIELHQTGRVDRLQVTLDVTILQMLENGIQSWSTVRRCAPDDVRPVRSQAPRWFRGQMLAERDGAGIELSGDTFLVYDRGVIGFLGARHCFGRLRVDALGEVEAQWLLDSIELEPNTPVTLDALWLAEGNPGSLYSQYADFSGAEMHARTPRPVPAAWCSWYQYFMEVTPEDIRENLGVAVDHGFDVVQIDDGWQREIGVWTEVSDRWAEPLDSVATDIASKGATAGIWTAPFLAIDGGQIATEHSDWLVLNESGQPTTALHHGGWGGKVFALDTTNPEVLDHLRAVFANLRQQGFDYFKIDFCHAGAVVGSRSDPRATRAVALRRGLEAIRDGIGDDAYLLGCGCPLLSAVGVVDAMRVSEDVAPYWAPKIWFPGFEEMTVAARNSVEASLLRAPLHRRWFALDPDCVLLRTQDSELSSNERDFVAATAVATGGFIVLSDRLSLYGPEQWAQLSRLRDHIDDGARDLVDPFATPLEVRWSTGSAKFDWEARTFELLV
jgi:alpha-galactosidase